MNRDVSETLLDCDKSIKKIEILFYINSISALCMQYALQYEIEF